MKINSYFFSSFAIGALGLSKAQQLRRKLSEEGASKRRELRRFGLLDIDDIMDGFLPLFGPAVGSIIASNLDNVDLGLNFHQDLANLEVAPNCTSTASVDYGLGLLSGLTGFQIDSVELVPGSDSLDISFFGLNGLSWSGLWDIRGSFENDIAVDSEAVLSADACGVPIEETSSGRIMVENPGLSFRLGMDGSSSSIFSLASAIAESIDIQDAQFNYNNILPIIDGVFGNDLELDLSTILEGLFSDAFLNQLLPLLLELLQNGLQDGLPF